MAALKDMSRAYPRDGSSGKGGWWHNSQLAIVCFGIFLVLLAAQSLTGWREHNNDARSHHEMQISFEQYLTTGHFYETTFENWESEFLQMAAYIALTVFLIQRGSAESKDPEGDAVDEDPAAHRLDPDAPWPVRQGGVWLAVYKNSLLIAFAVLFLLSMLGHALGGTAAYNSEQAQHGDTNEISVVEFVRTSQFWFQSFQNWQSEFFAVGSIVVLSIFLRQHGSSESKPVHAPNRQTGSG